MSYDPEIWLESVIREIKRYVEDRINTRIYQVVMEFPGSIIDADKLPINKTIIHFEIDSIDTTPIGMGDNIFAQNYDSGSQSVQPQYAEKHLINFDVGVWASDQTGGTTARLKVKQILHNIFGVGAVAVFRDYTDGGDGGIEILNFTGGRFVIDVSANDIRLYRMVDCQLNLRVFSRTPLDYADEVGTIEEIDQSPELTVPE